MQLKKSRDCHTKKRTKPRNNIRNKLALASSALLLSVPATSIAAEKVAASEVDNVGISQLLYQETDRVSVEKTQALITKEVNENNLLKLNFVYDTMSGASPNGRIYSVINGSNNGSNSGDITFTSASGGADTVADNSGGTSIEAWKTAFSDTRTAFNAEWEHSFHPGFVGIVGGGTSKENDYNSNTFSGKVLFDTNQRRTTLTTGVSFSFDTVSPFGGVPDGASALVCHENAFYRPVWLVCDGQKAISKPAQKILNDYLIGVTQVWNRRTLMQFNFAFGIEDGYLSDPYKQVSVLNSKYDVGEIAVLYENRPRSRLTKSLYYKVVHVPTNQTAMHFSYRLYWDDWGVYSDTFDGRLRMNISPRVYIQTHARAHWQTAAKFFKPFAEADLDSINYEQNGPNFISADSRLGALVSFTGGVKIGVQLNKESEASFRIEKMTQRYGDNLLPTMQVIISQINLIFKF